MKNHVQRILVWDLPTRIFHWSLVTSFFGAHLTAEGDYRVFHVLFGYTFLGLLGFRLVWGFTGTTYVRFRNFLKGPSAVLSYARSLFTPHPQHFVGHNPVGAMAIVMLLSLGLMTGITGLLAYDETWGGDLARLHDLLATVMLGVVAIHVLGSVMSSVLHRENLIGAMLTGIKDGLAEHGIRDAHTWLGLMLATVILAFWLLGLPALSFQTDSGPEHKDATVAVALSPAHNRMAPEVSP